MHYQRKMVKKMAPDGQIVDVEKEWAYFEKSDTPTVVSFGEVKEITDSLGRGLKKLGVTDMNPSGHNPDESSKICLFGSTTAQWVQMFLAAQTQSLCVVTAYASLGIDGLKHSLVETSTRAIFADNDLLFKLIEPLKVATDVKFVIHMEKIDPNDKRGDGRLYKNAHDAVEKIKESRPDITFYTFDEVLKIGRDAKDLKPIPPKPDDVCCIMYTSGSTGTPKGVVLTHSNVVGGIGGVSTVLDHTHMNKTDRVICILPLAHIFQLVIELIGFYWGACHCYANAKTLTSASCKNCLGDMMVYKPTFMPAVGAIWEALKKGLLAQISLLPRASQKIFWNAYNAKIALTSRRNHRKNALSSAIDSLVFKKVRAFTGGCLKLNLNGGSGISIETQKFLTQVLDAPMLIGYGLTETTANTCLMDPKHFEYGCCGSMAASLTMKLVDVPESGYFAKNNQGEVVIKGSSITVGYYKNEEETKKAFCLGDGWFSTGDIGEWLPNGSLKLIDRRKNMIKNLNGEYIALEKLESIYKANPVIGNICCYADD
ncbi:unnamed protein product [Ambrosiozyma monospora]|uniref:Unnamed protein product n=1 Tax=Ambrosiozyma monospora TaxID=43982 RepID=A0ACB5TQR2_AMBMO|nr:unnamed protein product [Ambrosiozyma monospora]